jgi:hypothetical protein
MEHMKYMRVSMAQLEERAIMLPDNAAIMARRLLTYAAIRNTRIALSTLKSRSSRNQPKLLVEAIASERKNSTAFSAPTVNNSKSSQLSL